MRTHRRVVSGMLALVLSLSAAAGEVYRVGAGAPLGGNTYDTLEELRQTASLGSGDTIILYNNDDTLLGPLDWNGITIRSAGNNRFTVSPAGNAFAISVAVPSLEINNLHIDAPALAAIVRLTNDTPTDLSGTLTVTDSILQSANGTGVIMNDLERGTFRNTQILDTLTSLWITHTPPLYDYSEVDIQFDGNAGVYNRWDGNVSIDGRATLNVDVAERKYFTIDSITAPLSTLTKTGGGTLKIGAGNNAVSILTINQGTVHFNERSNWSGENIHVGANGVFKPSIGFDKLAEWVNDPDTTPNPGARSTFDLDTFTSEEGARLEIGNVSTLPDYRSVNLISGTHNIFIPLLSAENGYFASTMRIDNGLMTAYIEERTDPDDTEYLPGYYLNIGNIRNLATLEGIGSYADAYRLNPNLSEMERDMLDTIYARGGAGEYRGYLQTLGGAVIQNSLLALHRHNANITGRINRRLTSYQDEELANIPSYLNEEAPAYAEEDPVNFYSETWAFLEHDWAAQEDVGNDAAYRLGLTTLGIGHDWHADQWIYGGMLAYGTGSMKLTNQRATRNEVDFLTAAAYISWAEDGWYLSGTGTATYGWNSARSVYALPGVTLASDSDFSSSGLGINIEAGHMLETEFYGIPLRVTPYGSLAYTRMHRDGVNDAGARNAALGIDLRKRFDDADWNVWDAALGVRVAVPMEVEGMTVLPSVDVSYVRTAGGASSGGGAVRMYSNPSSAWRLGLMESNRSALRMAANVEAQIRENVSLGAGYEFELREQYWNNRLNVNVSIDF